MISITPICTVANRLRDPALNSVTASFVNRDEALTYSDRHQTHSPELGAAFESLHAKGWMHKATRSVYDPGPWRTFYSITIEGATAYFRSRRDDDETRFTFRRYRPNA